MSSLTRLSLANRSLIALISIAAAAFGLLAIPALKQQLIPSLEFPAAFITAQYPGAAPDVVESQVVQPIEDAVRGVPGVTKTTSTAQEGFASIQVELDYGTDIDQTSSRLQSALARISSTLPDGTDPQVFAGSTDDFLPAVALAASGGDTSQLAQKLQKIVIPELNAIEGVRTAELTGAPEKNVVITPKKGALAQNGLSTSSITTALQGAGTPVPAGTVTDGTTSLAVQTGGRLDSIQDIENLYLAPGPAPATSSSSAGTTPAAGAVTQAPKPVKLGSVATVESENTDATSLTRTNGRDSLGLSVTMSPDGNAVDISHEIGDRISGWQEQLGNDAELTVVFDQAPFIQKSIRSLATEGLLGLVMAVVVILVFLLSVRSTLVTAVSIPLSVLVALIVMRIDGLSLNILTLGALTIAVGRVVDDSIVVLENIKRHLSYGEEKVRAVYEGAREVSGAITASTLTTVAVFLPIGLVGGVVGELFRPFAITVTVSLLASLLVALTIVPVLAYWFLKQPAGEDPDAVRRAAEDRERRSWLQVIYVPVIRFAVKRRWTTVALSLVILVATLAMTPFLKTNFIDQSGQNSVAITQTLPVGSSLAASDDAAAKIETVLAQQKQDGVLTDYQTTVGGGQIPGFGGSANQIQYALTVDEDRDVEAVQADLEKELKPLAGDSELEVGASGGGFGGSTDLAVVVQAPDAATLVTATEAIRKTMATVTDVTDVTTDLAEQSPRVEIRTRPEEAARYGLTDASIGALVATAFRGTPAGQVVIDGVQQDIRVSTGTSPASEADVRAIRIPTPTGPVPLTDVATVSTADAPVSIGRIDGARSATVTGKPTGDNLGAASQDMTTKLKDVDLPAGATYQIGGATADQQESFSQLGMALLAAIVIVFVVMVATFRSLVQPLILLVSIPFAATGALLLLLVTGTPLGIPALIGMLMLVGIVVTNAIVLLDLINQYRRDGVPLREAVVEGGRHRLRPILMTAIATIFALLPMAVGLTGEGGFISQPLAVVVIGGLTSSTLLTLVLVPALYTLVEGGKERRAAKRAAKRSSEDEPTSTPPQPVPTA